MGVWDVLRAQVIGNLAECRLAITINLIVLLHGVSGRIEHGLEVGTAQKARETWEPRYVKFQVKVLADPTLAKL